MSENERNLYDRSRRRRFRWFTRFASLRLRLTVAVAIVTGTGLVISGILLVHAVEATVLQAVENAYRMRLEYIRRQIEGGVAVDAVQVPDAEPRFFVKFMRPDSPKVLVLKKPGSETPQELSGPPPVEALPSHGDPTSRDRLILRLPLVSPREGPMTVVAVSSLDGVRRSIDTLSRALTFGIPVALVLLTGAAWWLIGRTLAPVRDMSARAAGIADATSGERLAVPATLDEVAELARTLNGMLDRLASGARRQRQFVSDASHELRSPIAATRALLEVSLAHPEHGDRTVNLKGALAEILRLEALVSDLLTLARLDEGHAPAYAEVDLDDIVLEEAARPRSISIDTKGVRAVKMHGDHNSLTQLVRNVLDNAARHGASHVRVSTERTADGLVLTVDDDGPGIPDADQERVFERFTRLASSRARSAGGAGLGLALVRRIAEQHGGNAQAGRSPLGGARLEIRLRHRSSESFPSS